MNVCLLETEGFARTGIMIKLLLTTREKWEGKGKTGMMTEEKATRPKKQLANTMTNRRLMSVAIKR